MPALPETELEDDWFTSDEADLVVEEPEAPQRSVFSMAKLVGIGALVASIAACSTFLG